MTVSPTDRHVDVGQSAGAWAAVADDHDLLPETGALLDWLMALAGDRTPAAVTVGRARVHLLEGEAHLGRELLRSQGQADPLDPTRPTWQGAVADACRAAGGDREAFERVRAVTATTTESRDGTDLAYLLAVAAAGCGETETADKAWIDLPTRLGKVTPLTLTRYAAARVAGRDRQDPDPGLATVLEAAQAFGHLEVPLTVDASPALAAARLLDARGDAAGARLLLLALTRLHPPIPALTQALELAGPPPADVRRYRLRSTGLVVAGVLTLVWLSIVGVLIGRALMGLHARKVALPGLDVTDSRVARALRHLSYDDAHERVRDTGGQTQVDPLQALATVVGLFGGALLGVPVATALEDRSPFLGLGLALAVVVAVASGSWWTTRALQQRWIQRRVLRRRAAERRALLATASTCSCWQTSWFSGDLAATYVESHLERLAADQDLSGLKVAEAGAHRCPDTGYLWLAVGSGASLRLLRGAVPPVRKDPEEPLPTGLYL